jgi:hypothetical protein
VILALSQPAAESPYRLTVGVWAIGERVLTFRDFRSGAWKSRQDSGSQLAIVACFVVGFFASLGLRRLLPGPSPADPRDLVAAFERVDDRGDTQGVTAQA